MLHLIFQSPVALPVLERINTSDSVVFQERAVWTAISGHILQSQLERLMRMNCRLHVLQDDMVVNGIVPKQLTIGVAVIDYRALVELTVANKVIKSWR